MISKRLGKSIVIIMTIGVLATLVTILFTKSAEIKGYFNIDNLSGIISRKLSAETFILTGENLKTIDGIIPELECPVG